MKALTLWQPWATLVSLGHKTLETRSWPTEYRGPLAIHAGKATSQLYLQREYPYTKYLADYRSPFPLGCIVAICNLVDVWKLGSPNAWTDKEHRLMAIADIDLGNVSHGRYGWRLDDIQELALPIGATGKQRLWNWESPLQEHLLPRWEALRGTPGATKLLWPARDTLTDVTKVLSGERSPPSSMTTGAGNVET